MASTVKYGSKGDDVVALQNALNQKGYNLAVDGIYGSATQNAVRQYQQSMGLVVDGIVGANTWGALTGSSSGTASGSAAYNTYLPNLQTPSYTAKTEEQLLQEAINKYEPIYNQNKLSANQAYESTALALQQQLEALAPIYDRQREDTAKSYANAYSQADRQALSRGMQRSSFNNQTLANIDTQGAKAQDDIGAAQTQAESQIEQNKALAATQLAQYIQQLDNDYMTQVSAYQDALRDQDYERAFAAMQAANQLELALAELSQNNTQFLMQFEENQRQFNASLAASKSSGSSSKTATSTPSTSNVSLTDYLSSLYGTTQATENKWGVGGSVYNAWVANGSPSGGAGTAISDKGELVNVKNNTPKKIKATTSYTAK